jgi:hypothetical protein
LCSGKGNGHAQGGGIGDVESGETFGPVETASAMGDGTVGGSMDLHSLLDDWGAGLERGSELSEGGHTIERVHESITRYSGACAAESWFLCQQNDFRLEWS